MSWCLAKFTHTSPNQKHNIIRSSTRDICSLLSSSSYISVTKIIISQQSSNSEF